MVGSDVDQLVRALRGRQVAIVDRMLSGLDLPLSAWYPLIVLGTGDGISQRDVAKRIKVRDATVSKTIEALVQRSLLQRMPHVSDRRKTLLALTAEGRGVASQVSGWREALLAELSRGFSDTEQAQFKDLLRRACANLADASLQPQQRIQDHD